MESIYPKLALRHEVCGSKNECGRTDTVFFPTFQVCTWRWPLFIWLDKKKHRRNYIFMHMSSVSPIIFLGERCFIAGLAVSSVSLYEAVCQDDETYELYVWLVLYCSEFHWCFNLAFLTFQVYIIVSCHFWQKPVFGKIFFSCKNSIWSGITRMEIYI